MKTIKDYTDEELRHGITRCEARLDGTMPKGIMSIERIKEALKSYRNELEIRGIKELEFE